MTILFSDEILPFGKYKDRTISSVLAIDPDYFKRSVNYLKSNQYAFSDEVINKAYNLGKTKKMS